MENEISQMGEKQVRSVVTGLIAVIVGLAIFFSSWFTVAAGEVGVVTRFGAVNRVVGPGFGTKFPFVESVAMMDTRIQKDQVEAQAASKDLQIVKSTIAVNYHLNGSHATDVYQQIGQDYQDKVISPAIQDTFKAVTAQFTAEQLIDQREQVRSSAQQELVIKLTPYNIVVDNFNIVNFDFSADFNTAIEQKQVAQQQVETAKQTLAKTQVEAQTAVAQAEGQAKAQAALKDSGALTPEYLQYLALTKWKGDLPTYWGGNALPFINVGK